MPTDPGDIPYAELVTAFQQTPGGHTELPAAMPALQPKRKEAAAKLSSPGQAASPRPTNRSPLLFLLLGMLLGSVFTAILLSFIGLGLMSYLGSRPIASSWAPVTKVARNDRWAPPAANPGPPLPPPPPFPRPPAPGAVPPNRPQPKLPVPPETVPFTVDPALASAKSRVYLSDLQEFAWIPGPDGWTFAKNGDLGNSFLATPGRIVVKGKEVSKGLTMHPPHSGHTRIRYALGAKAKTLSGSVAISEDDPRFARASASRFVILGDDQVLWRSGPIGDTGVSEPFTVDVRGVRILELRTSVENNNATGAHAVWMDPYLLPK
jgi:hypothetical protein